VSRLLPATAPVTAAWLVNAGTLPASARSTGGAAARAAPAPARAAVTALSATTAAIVLLMTTFLPLSTEGNICHEQDAQNMRNRCQDSKIYRFPAAYDTGLLVRGFQSPITNP
jgi:hypothetical protein